MLEHFEFDSCRIYLMDKSGRHLNLAAFRGTDPGGLERVGITEGFTGKAARTHSFIAQHVSELEDKKRAALLTSKGFKIIICVPLIAAGEVVGVMNLSSGKLIKLDQEMIDLLEVIGNQISVAIKNAWFYENILKKKDKLLEKKNMIEFFAYSTSHDLKGPAIAIYGISKLLNKKYSHILNDKGRDYCEQIQKTSEQIVTLVEKINIYVQAKVAPLNIEDIRIGEIINELKEEFSSVLESRHINWRKPKEDHLIRADRLSITRVLRNLVDNALKYGGDNLSEISIGYKEDENLHFLSVGDDGVGVKKDQYENIFRVYQREKTSQGTAGAGLGLAIVKEVAERHGGRAWAEPGPEKGTTFYVAISKKLQRG
ncbi:MAG: GAF domain-containing sensor histidine kinase [Deltaproteobacteria bacterium]|nr:GAF domain-containing sensor histidine kinase [Deltaproteobacteria bacterium]MBW1939179.1 GAF domain-containing sensor histidine kinase [Deltaproteobacteria bacterium]MBW1965331.1 GAF domain-containing sensor histidine kinase [Deltaproteobacteria bacterium]MBW2081263.1 GAF domain-containing sensor histidine kinase [Deltaproteobacteria bacterium]MBW2350907.1 GAF domain-containing sensor histidine kinase [Deltaproteobacteria bacterium]